MAAKDFIYGNPSPEDDNSGIIDRREKSQAVFFSKEVIKVVETIPNTMRKRDVLRKKRERGDYSGS